MGEHYPALFIAYAVVVASWWSARFVLQRLERLPPSWCRPPEWQFARPWREFGLALLGGVGVLLVGQLYSLGWMLPRTGPLGPILESFNQVLIFAPILAVPFLRRQGVDTILLPREAPALRLGTGVAIAFLALSVYSTVRTGSVGPLELVRRIAAYPNLDKAVQVLLEDLTIGLLLVRLVAAVGARVAVVGVGLLFAAGHVPALINTGVTLGEMGSLVGDFLLTVLVLGTVLRSGDVLWIWPVHFVMDMTQFSEISGV